MIQNKTDYDSFILYIIIFLSGTLAPLLMLFIPHIKFEQTIYLSDLFSTIITFITVVLFGYIIAGRNDKINNNSHQMAQSYNEIGNEIGLKIDEWLNSDRKIETFEIAGFFKRKRMFLSYLKKIALEKKYLKSDKLLISMDKEIKLLIDYLTNDYFMAINQQFLSNNSGEKIISKSEVYEKIKFQSTKIMLEINKITYSLKN